MGKTRDLFKKIRDTKGTFHAKMEGVQEMLKANIIYLETFIEVSFASIKKTATSTYWVAIYAT